MQSTSKLFGSIKNDQRGRKVCMRLFKMLSTKLFHLPLQLHFSNPPFKLPIPDISSACNSREAAKFFTAPSNLCTCVVPYAWLSLLPWITPVYHSCLSLDSSRSMILGRGVSLAASLTSHFRHRLVIAWFPVSVALLTGISLKQGMLCCSLQSF